MAQNENKFKKINQSLESCLLPCRLGNIVFLQNLSWEITFRPVSTEWSDQRINLPADIAVLKLIIIDVCHHKILLEIVTIYSSFTHEQTLRASVSKYCIERRWELCNPPMTLLVKALKCTCVFPCKTAPSPSPSVLLSFASSFQVADVLPDCVLNVRNLVSLRCVDSRASSDHGTHQRWGAEPCHHVAR